MPYRPGLPPGPYRTKNAGTNRVNLESGALDHSAILTCFGANQSLHKGPTLKIPLRLQFHSTVFVNDITPQKWLLFVVKVANICGQSC